MFLFFSTGTSSQKHFVFVCFSSLVGIKQYLGCLSPSLHGVRFEEDASVTQLTLHLAFGPGKQAIDKRGPGRSRALTD